MTTKVTDDMLASDYVQVGEVQGVPSGGTGRSSVTAGNFLRGTGATAMEERTPAQVRGDISAQASSAVLDALAAISANRFMARGSGDPNAVAKTITDFILTLMDDADAATARSTLGIPGGTTYNPVITSVANVASSVPHPLQWFRIGNVVHVSGAIDITPTATTTLTQARFTLPVASNFASSWECASAAAIGQGPVNQGLISADSTNDQALLTFTSTGTTLVRCFFAFSYLVI